MKRLLLGVSKVDWTKTFDFVAKGFNKFNLGCGSNRKQSKLDRIIVQLAQGKYPDAKVSPQP